LQGLRDLASALEGWRLRKVRRVRRAQAQLALSLQGLLEMFAQDFDV